MNKDLYQPLPDGHIRVLRLEGWAPLETECDKTPSLEEPGSLQNSQHECLLTLQEVSLEDVRAGRILFDALSYCWGEATTARHHKVHFTQCKETYPITKNLHEALTQLTLDRLHVIRDGMPALYWADALCINQGDDREKNHQVALMGQIYSLAKEVICWLGFGQHWENEAVHSLFQHLKKIANEMPSYEGGFGDALETLAGAEWFTRAWTFQEAVLASKPVLHYASSKAEFAWFWYRGTHDYDVFFYPAGFYSPAHRNLERKLTLVSNARKNYHEKREGGLLDCLASIHDREAGDPRDKVFSILGLADAQPWLAADYTKSRDCVFQETAQACIQQDGDLKILAYLAIKRGPSDIFTRFRVEETATRCSWVPDWSCSKQYRGFVQPRVAVFPKCPRWAQFSPLFPKNELRVEGVALGRIKDVVTYPQFSATHTIVQLFASDSGNMIIRSLRHLRKSRRPIRSRLPGTCLNEQSGDWIAWLFGLPALAVLRPENSISTASWPGEGEQSPQHGCTFTFIGCLNDVWSVEDQPCKSFVSKLENQDTRDGTFRTLREHGLDCVHGSFRIR